MCKELPVILVNRAVDKKIIIGKIEGPPSPPIKRRFTKSRGKAAGCMESASPTITFMPLELEYFRNYKKENFCVIFRQVFGSSDRIKF
jgi:hypothetical protein